MDRRDALSGVALDEQQQLIESSGAKGRQAGSENIYSLRREGEKALAIRKGQWLTVHRT